MSTTVPQPPKPSPSELFLALCETPAPSEIYQYPRKGLDKEFRMLVLSVEQHQEARTRAQRKLEKLKFSDTNGVNLREVYGDMVAKELLAMAVVGVDPIPGSEQRDGGVVYPRHFQSAEEFGSARVSADELSVLFTLYTLTQAKYGPFDHVIENEHQLTKWMELLVKGATAAPLARCDWRALVASSMLLARRAYTLSALLESQRSSLPDTLVSILDGLGHGMCELGKLPAQLTETGWDGSGEWMPLDPSLDAYVDGDLSDDVRDAARAAEQMHKRGE